MTRFYRFFRGILTPIAHFYFRLKKIGVENIPKTGGVVLCCNHTSLTDIWLLIVACPRQICFMAKEELFRNPLAKWLFTRMGAFPVSRGHSDRTAVRRGLEIAENGGLMGIFPEGKRYKDLPPQKVKPGAALIAIESGAMLLPVAIYRKNGKVHLWQKATVRFGIPIAHADFCPTDGGASKTALRTVSALIQQKITELWEMKS